MLHLVLLILAGYAVRCEESSYYVIEAQEEGMPSEMRPSATFKVFWNVPTMQCTSKRIPFDNLYQKYGIIQNEGDHFRGEKIAILYDPGIFPALLKNESSGQLIFRNGGVPQEGDLDRHLNAFEKVMEQSVMKDFAGVGIIDFESWRPIYRQNFGVLAPYKDVSYEIERSRHWWWTKSWLQAEAMLRFEKSAEEFMHRTLLLAKQLRSKAIWGYYAFPYCFNMAPNNLHEKCADRVPQENDRIPWLWSESTALYPSLYSSKDLSTQQLQQLIRGRVKEALRNNRKNSPILPYFWFKYRDDGFMSQKDLKGALETLYRSKASGLIIWGSSNDVNTKDKCLNLLSYLENILGPTIARYTKSRNKETLDDADDTKFGNMINNHNSSTATKPNLTEIFTDPDFDWDPPENYTEDIVYFVQNELKNKSNITNTDYLGDTSAGNDLKMTEASLPNLKTFSPVNESESQSEVFKQDRKNIGGKKENCTNVNNEMNLNNCNISDSKTIGSVIKINLEDKYEDRINANESKGVDIAENRFVDSKEVIFKPIEVPMSLAETSDIADNSGINSNTFLLLFTQNTESSKHFDEMQIEKKLRSSNTFRMEKNRKKGFTAKPSIREPKILKENGNDTTQGFLNRKREFLNTNNIRDVNHLAENDIHLIVNTESQHKKNLRHSKNRKKGRRRNMKYVNSNAPSQDETTQSFIPSNTYETTELTKGSILNDGNIQSPETYRLIESKDIKKGPANVESTPSDKSNVLQNIVVQRTKSQNSLVENSEEITTVTEKYDDHYFTTEQVIIYEVIQD